MKYTTGFLNVLRYICLTWVIILGLITIVGTSGDGDRRRGSSESNESDEAHGEAVDVIGPAGGVVEVSDPDSAIYGARVEIPPDALTEEITISMTDVEIPADLPRQYFAAGQCISLEPDGIVFETPVRLFFPYSDNDNDGIVDRTTMSEQDVRVMVLNQSSGQWEDIELVSQDQSQNLVEVKANHFSYYVISRRIPATCETDGYLSCGPYYLTLHFAYGWDNQYKASVSPVGADIYANNTILYDTYAVLEYADFKDLFDDMQDATKWAWTWEVVTELTYLTHSVGLKDDEVQLEISALSPASLQFTWNFDYHQMAAHERLVVKFAGTSEYFCTDAGI